MKLKAQVNNREVNVVLEETDARLSVQIDDRTYNLNVHNSDDTAYLLVNETRVYECRVESMQKSRERFEVQLKGKRHAIAIIDPRRLRTGENSDRHHHGPLEIAAQMPGKVVRVLVEAGAKVEKGDGIIVVEAMKMQNEMKSPRAGVVGSVNVKPGDTVNAGEVLATVEEASNE